MKVSEQFKSTIKAYLDNMAAVDSLFAPVYQKPTKNIDNCITYILNQVKKSDGTQASHGRTRKASRPQKKHPPRDTGTALTAASFSPAA